jgi:hypothetical protein
MTPRHIQDSTIDAIRRKTDRMLESAEMYREGRDINAHLADVYDQYAAIGVLLNIKPQARS